VAAREFPSRPLPLVVPFAAGGSSGLIARMMLPRMSEALGQQIVIENMGGADGMTGAPRVSELERRSQPVEDRAGDGVTGLEGPAEVAAHGRPGPRRVLQHEGPVQPEPLADAVGAFGEISPPMSTASGPARRHAHDREQDDRHAEQHQRANPSRLTTYERSPGSMPPKCYVVARRRSTISG
jgi:hypothetical protein